MKPRLAWCPGDQLKVLKIVDSNKAVLKTLIIQKDAIENPSFRFSNVKITGDLDKSNSK